MPNPKTVRATLKQARRLIAEKGWTQDTYARDANGERVDEDSRQATCFCIYGAVKRAKPQWLVEQDTMDCLDDLAAGITGFRNIVGFNDRPTTTREDVLAALDQAIEVAEVMRI